MVGFAAGSPLGSAWGAGSRSVFFFFLLALSSSPAAFGTEKSPCCMENWVIDGLMFNGCSKTAPWKMNPNGTEEAWCLMDGSECPGHEDKIAYSEEGHWRVCEYNPQCRITLFEGCLTGRDLKIHEGGNWRFPPFEEFVARSAVLEGDAGCEITMYTGMYKEPPMLTLSKATPPDTPEYFDCAAWQERGMEVSRAARVDAPAEPDCADVAGTYSFSEYPDIGDATWEIKQEGCQLTIQGYGMYEITGNIDGDTTYFDDATVEFESWRRPKCFRLGGEWSLSGNPSSRDGVWSIDQEGCDLTLYDFDTSNVRYSEGHVEYGYIDMDKVYFDNFDAYPEGQARTLTWSSSHPSSPGISFSEGGHRWYKAPECFPVAGTYSRSQDLESSDHTWVAMQDRCRLTFFNYDNSMDFMEGAVSGDTVYFHSNDLSVGTVPKGTYAEDAGGQYISLHADSSKWFQVADPDCADVAGSYSTESGGRTWEVMQDGCQLLLHNLNGMGHYILGYIAGDQVYFARDVDGAGTAHDGHIEFDGGVGTWYKVGYEPPPAPAPADSRRRAPPAPAPAPADSRRRAPPTSAPGPAPRCGKMPKSLYDGLKSSGIDPVLC